MKPWEGVKITRRYGPEVGNCVLLFGHGIMENKYSFQWAGVMQVSFPLRGASVGVSREG